jgi:hypothetical protein
VGGGRALDANEAVANALKECSTKVIEREK